MWRKIHSDRDPRDTLYSELRKEFRPWFEKLTGACRSLLSRNPKAAYSGMLILLLLSAAISFTVFRHPDTSGTKQPAKAPAVFSDGFSQIMATAGKLRETIRLKKTVDSLTSGKQLNAADSLLLDSVLSRLQQIQQLK
ncbi:hypothetical protein LJ707_02110 [Mucilaginibacter sp. UR6-1]|uniref:hypothetical protein n=1 Tax=Mucilaginibacter sp. UR6-1 TaxID=1435643 RepID=UPI001E3A53F1|nr:hypothetical protein [Mucilaginibacter sp. UR6-1]MCC8407705.1 hypothetical protein [Mucilaginibacter sp. UR6-1]